MKKRSPAFVVFCGVLLFVQAYTSTAAPSERAAMRAFVAAPENNVSVTKRPSGFASFIGAAPGRPLPNVTLLLRAEDRARAFLNSNRDLFVEPSANFELLTTRVSENDEVGISHVRVQQLVNGIPVHGAEAVVHLNDTGVTAVSSNLVPTPDDLATTPTISSDVATATAQQVISKLYGPVDANFSAPELQIFDVGLIFGAPGRARLTWYIEASSDTVRERIWIDAQSGALILNFSQLTDARNRRTFDANSSSSIPATPARTETQGPTGNADVDAAHDFAGDFYNYYFTEHGRDSFDGAGKTIDSVVRYCDSTGCPLRNAFWNGTRITFGLGFAVDDVVGHELTHAVIQYTSNLDYLNEPGALNESYADIFGETIDLWNVKGNDAANMRWLMGEEIPGAPLGKGIRNMMNPGAFGDPTRIKDSTYYCSTADNGGVHTNSGVTNHAYALMVDGGTFNGYTIVGIGVTKAAKIQYRAMARYLTTSSKFLDNFNFLIQSCNDLIGTSGITHDDCAQVKQALLAVEMSTPPCSNVNPPATPPAAPAPVPAVIGQCSSGQVVQNIFADDLENTASGNWVTTTASGLSHWTGATGNPAIYEAGNAAKGTYAFHGKAVGSAADSSVQMKNSFVLPPNAFLQFDGNYDFETGFDGGVLEYSTDAGATWSDAGALITLGRNYDGGLVNGVSNPLGGRTAFTGHTGQYVSSQLNLNGLSGRSVRFRFRMGTDKTVASPGWWVDNIALYTCAQAVPGVTVAPVSGLQTTEAGGTATFTVVLGSAPTANVTIDLSSGNPDEGTVTPGTVTFTSTNWNVPQTITIRGVDDAVDDDNIVYAIVTSNAVSADATYNNMVVPDVSVTNIDNDAAGIVVNPTTTITTTEAGSSVAYSVVLTSQPIANVTLNVASNNTNEGTVAPTSVTFTPANWNTAHSITVTGVDDAVVDGNVAYQITSTISTTDAKYAAMSVAALNAVNMDNDAIGIAIAPTSGLTTTESGGTATYSIVLTSQPSANVVLNIVSSNTNEGTVSPATVTFTSTNWNVSRTVTLSGVDDNVTDGNIAYQITTTVSTTDAGYAALTLPVVNATNLDNDVVGITVAPTSGLTTTESGGTATFSVHLNSQPTSNVTIGISSSNTAEGTVAPASLTFTSANWNVSQTVKITGVDDAVIDGNVSYTIITAPAVSTDPNYSARNAPDVSVSNSDNDQANILVMSGSLMETSESGSKATFSIALSALPAGNITVYVKSSNTAEGTVDRDQIIFTATNWNQQQVVTVTGVDDQIIDGDVAYTIITSPASSSDPKYNALNAADVEVVNHDNDVASIDVSAPAKPETTESGGTLQFTVALSHQPKADVSIALKSSNSNEGTVAPNTLLFTASDWNTPKVVTVTGVDDTLVDGNVSYLVSLDPGLSADTIYRALNVQSITVVNRDDEAATGAQGNINDALVIAAGTNLVTTEGGGGATFTIKLSHQPTSSVSIPLRSSNPNEGVVSPSSLNFDPNNWDTPQTVSVTGVDDTAKDGNVEYSVLISTPRSADKSFSTIGRHEVSVVNEDNDAKAAAAGAFGSWFLLSLWIMYLVLRRGLPRIRTGILFTGRAGFQPAPKLRSQLGCESN